MIYYDFIFMSCLVWGGYGIVSADHIKSIPKLKHIFENRYSVAYNRRISCGNIQIKLKIIF
jgi:hypothetical protein